MFASLVRNSLFSTWRLAIFLSVLAVGRYPAQGQSSTDAGLTLQNSGIKFKSAILQERVLEAIEQAKQNDVSYINELMDLNKADPDRVLRLLDRYKKDEDSNVKFGVIEASSQANTDKSMAILISMVSDPDVGHEAVRVLYDNNDCRRIVEKGGKKLEGAVVREFISNRYSTYATLLLSCFKGNRETVDLLERRRKSYTVGPQQNTINEIISIDLALGEMGKADALERVNQRFAAKRIEELLALVLYLKFVSNKGILLQSVELLKDKRRIYQSTAPAGADYIIPKDRVCDKAIQFLAARANVPTGVKILPGKIYSDQELAQAYQKIKASFTIQ